MTDHTARHDEAIGMDRIGRVWTDHHVARRRQGLGQIGKAFFRAKGGDDFGVWIELDAITAVIIAGHRLTQTTDALGG